MSKLGKKIPITQTYDVKKRVKTGDLGSKSEWGEKGGRSGRDRQRQSEGERERDTETHYNTSNHRDRGARVIKLKTVAPKPCSRCTSADFSRARRINQGEARWVIYSPQLVKLGSLTAAGCTNWLISAGEGGELRERQRGRGCGGWLASRLGWGDGWGYLYVYCMSVCLSLVCVLGCLGDFLKLVFLLICFSPLLSVSHIRISTHTPPLSLFLSPPPFSLSQPPPPASSRHKSRDGFIRARSCIKTWIRHTNEARHSH